MNEYSVQPIREEAKYSPNIFQKILLIVLEGAFIFTKKFYFYVTLKVIIELALLLPEWSNKVKNGFIYYKEVMFSARKKILKCLIISCLLIITLDSAISVFQTIVCSCTSVFFIVEQNC